MPQGNLSGYVTEGARTDGARRSPTSIRSRRMTTPVHADNDSHSAAPLKTPLHDAHVALGARMVPFAGYLMPVQYEGILAEHAHCRAAAMITSSARALTVSTGEISSCSGLP